jgi:hypothetical protein
MTENRRRIFPRRNLGTVIKGGGKECRAGKYNWCPLLLCFSIGQTRKAEHRGEVGPAAPELVE